MNVIYMILQVLGAMVIAALLNFGIDQILLRRWRKAASLHWTEQARILHPISTTTRVNLWLIPAIIAMAFEIFWPGRVYWEIDAVAAWICTYLTNYSYVKSLFPQFTFKSWIYLSIFGSGFLFFFYGSFILAGFVMPSDFGWITWMIFTLEFFCIVIMVQGSAAVWLFCKIGWFKQADERTLRIATEAANEAKTDFRHIWIFESPIYFGGALFWVNDLLFSNTLIESLTDEEFSTICHHELAHLNEPLSTKLRRFVSYFVFLPFVLITPVVHRYSIIGFALLYLCFLIIAWIPYRLSRKMEVRADSIASSRQALQGVYARALEKLYKNNRTPVVMRKNNLPHPHLYDRMVSAGLTPDYPRPKPPKATTWPLALLFIVGIVMVYILASRQ